jgi:protein-S-isoprenylcysteine O-methyltransferase Ste14
MAVAVALQTLYVCDALWSEAAILTTMDIVMDGFGFMLAFGDLAWVPAMYSLQPRFLAVAVGAHAPSAAFALAGAVAGCAGFYVFRAANAQKDTFKTNPTHPSVARLPVIVHENGRLLAGGWWGAARHVNYAGDLLLALGMSICTGVASPFTYFYPAYFAVLLWHRELRDDHKCSHKYGKAWEEYKRRVPYAIVPGVY